jgi:hypothetical protein
MNDANMNDIPNPNTLIQTRIDDDSFSKNMINYSNDIITRDINQYKSCPIMINTNCIDNNLNNIHLCTTRPPNPKEFFFTTLFQNGICKFMNICNWQCM